MVKKRLPLYQKMLSFTYCKRQLLYHRKFSLTQLSGRSYIIGSSPLTQCRWPLLCKRVLSPRYECSHIYIKGHSLPVMSGCSYLDTQQWGQPPLYQCSFSKGGHKQFYHSKRGNGKVVFTFSKESVTGGAGLPPVSVEAFSHLTFIYFEFTSAWWGHSWSLSLSW